MSAAFALTLDTKAPAVTRGEASHSDVALRLPYTTDEPGLESAVAVRSNGQEILGTIEPDRVLFALDEPWAGGQILLRTRDSVWNSREYVVDVPIIHVPVTEVRTYTLGWGAGMPDESVKEQFTRGLEEPNPMVYKRK